MKKLIHILIAIVVCSLGTTPASAANATLSDIQTEPYKQAIQTLFDNNIVNGYSDGSFRAENSINRAEFTKIVMGAITTQKDRKTCRFSKKFKDVKLNDWFSPYVCMAVKKGVIQGYDDDTFRPQNPINFAEAAKIIAYTFKGSITNQENWYDGSVAYLSDNKSIPPTISALNKNINRGEMAEILWRTQAKVTSKRSQKFYQGRLINAASESTRQHSDKIQLDHKKRKAFMKICEKRTKIEPLSRCLSRMITNQ